MTRLRKCDENRLMKLIKQTSLILPVLLMRLLLHPEIGRRSSRHRSNVRAGEDDHLPVQHETDQDRAKIVASSSVVWRCRSATKDSLMAPLFAPLQFPRGSGASGGGHPAGHTNNEVLHDSRTDCVIFVELAGATSTVSDFGEAEFLDTFCTIQCNH